MARDRVALTGSVIGLLSLAVGWLTLKSSRVAAGVSLNLWESFSDSGALLVVGLWVLCLVFTLWGSRRQRSIASGIIANLVLVFIFALAGLSARELSLQEGPVARISLGAGIWLSLAAAYMVIFAARQRLTDSPLWRNLVSWSGLALLLALVLSGWLSRLSIMQEFSGQSARFGQEFMQHIFLFAGSVALGTLVGIPLGIWAVSSRRISRPIFFIVNITQTVPSLALFGLLIAPLSALSLAFPLLRTLGVRGIGVTPAMIALIIYSLLPIVRNTYVSLRQLDPAVIDAGRGMGMSHAQVFRRLEAPLAAPLVLEGVRTAAVQSVGNAAVAALIGAGGLGWFVFEGLGQAAPDLIILGAIPIIVLALLVDIVMRTIVRVATPKGLAGASR